MFALKLVLLLILGFAGAAGVGSQPLLALFYDPAVPQLAFAASEIAHSAPRALPAFPVERLSSASCSLCIVMASGASQSASLVQQLGVSPLRSGREQSYGIRRPMHSGKDIIVVLAADAAGAMYGGLDVAEAMRLGMLADLKDSDHSPRIERRGIKFNIPLDARTPSYSDNSDAAQANIPEMWSFDFWRSFLDEMARHRYNVLSLWNLHPFPSLVKVPEYPDVALADVKRTRIRMDDSYSHSGDDMVRPAILADLETVKAMSIGDKIRFWRDVMQYAMDRGIRLYLFTWNIFTYGADGKYGITAEQTNPATIAYFRASVRDLVLTYPLLAGIGITAGEHMSDLKGDFSKEKWLWKSYGEGVRDALQIQPGRDFRLIHRYHQSGQTEILNEFRDYPGPLDLSFKYSIAHMYSIPNPPFIQELLPNLPAGKRTWLTVRNDDVYSFRWGDPAYAREYIRNLPGPDKVAGFYMGPDGYTWGREFLSTEPDIPRQPVISKQWYSFQLWGRLSYEPDLPDSFFIRTLAERYPKADSAKLFRAWADASQVFPLITRFFWGDIDLRWFPEACLSHPRYHGYFTVRDFIEGDSMPGSGVLNILDWRRAMLAKEKVVGTTPLDIAAQLEERASRALEALPSLRVSVQDKELRLTLGDIEAMSDLALYYAGKIRGAAALALFDGSSEDPKKQEALRYLQAAAEHWRSYSRAYTAQYTQPHLYNRVGIVDIPALTKKALEDVEIARQWKPGTVVDEKIKRRSADQPFRK
jgi:hypothetical protein